MAYSTTASAEDNVRIRGLASGLASGLAGATRPSVSRIFMNVSRAEPLPAEDVRHVAQRVAQRTGLSQQDAEKRVTDTCAQARTRLRDTEIAAREAAHKARKASAYGALWLFGSLRIGAFVASPSATFGGRRRDA